MCGIVGVISKDGRSVVGDLGNGAHFLQHRGPAYAGLFVFDPIHRGFALEKGEGLADDIFKQLGDVPGDVGIAHTRYKTYGGGGTDNAQPFFDAPASMALAHNGHITNVPQIETELARRSQALAANCDADALLRVLALWAEHFRRIDPAAEEKEIIFKAIYETQQAITGAYSAVLTTPSGLFAFRDPHGFRPMVIGRRSRPGREAIMIASETLALEQNGFKVEDEVENGVALFVDRNLEVDRRVLLQRDPRPCAFELIYFADVESKMMGDKIRSYRWRAGRSLAMHVLEKNPDLVSEIDMVVPIPHSPIPGAEAFAQKLEKELETAVRLGLDLAIVVLVDDGFGMIRWKQAAMKLADFGLEFGNPDFVRFAEAHGAHGHAIADRNELGVAVAKALAQGGVHLFEVPIDYAHDNALLDERYPELARSLAPVPGDLA